MDKTIGFLLFNGLEELDFVGPWEIFAVWAKQYSGPSQIVTVSEHGGVVECAKSLQVISSHDFLTCPRLNYLVIPGGQGTCREVLNANLVGFIREKAKTCEAILSVCTGAFLLQAAGLLDGKKATTHWQSLDRLRAFPNIQVVEDRFVRDGNVWTAAGVSAGIDLALAFVAATAGDDVAEKVQLHAEYFPSTKVYGNTRQK